LHSIVNQKDNRMAAKVMGKMAVGNGLLNAGLVSRTHSKHNISSWSKKKKIVVGTAGLVGAGAVATAGALQYSVQASDLMLHPPAMPWEHNKWFTTLDAASVRRGFQVYQQVCAACHSLEYIAFRHLVGVSHTEDEAKKLAAECQVEDGPNDDGEMFMREGKLFDYLPKPYKNEKEARAKNGGALPPDLSNIVFAREGYEDYIFALLQGYFDPPAGVELGDEQHYNVYFPGGAIGMGQMLYNEVIEYEDGTPATQTQLSKDVTTFLRWTADPHLDKKQLISFRVFLAALIFVPLLWYQKRRFFTMVKSRKIAYKPTK